MIGPAGCLTINGGNLVLDGNYTPTSSDYYWLIQAAGNVGLTGNGFGNAPAFLGCIAVGNTTGNYYYGSFGTSTQNLVLNFGQTMSVWTGGRPGRRAARL